mgnify:FL=1
MCNAKRVYAMDYKVNWDSGGVFAVPDAAAEALLKYRRLPDDPDEIGVTAEDIDEALSYWSSVGVIYRSGNAPQAKSQPAAHEPVRVLAPKPETAVPAAAIPAAAVPAAPEKEVIRPRKSLLPTEIAERIAESQEIALLFKSAEGSLKRVLTFDDQRTILWIYDHLGMSADIIMMLIAYCCSVGRTNMGYIEKAALDWHEKNIATHEQAENEILLMQRSFTFEAKVQSRLKMQNKLTASQKKYIDEWARMDMSVDLVELAYDKTVDATGKPAFQYMNKILVKWHDNNITDMQSAIEFDERTKPSRCQAPRQAAQGRSTAAEKSAPSFDLSAIMEHARNSKPTV